MRSAPNTPRPHDRFRILIILPCLTLGGAEKQGAILARYLRDRGHDVTVWAFPSPTQEAPLKQILAAWGMPFVELTQWPPLEWHSLVPGATFWNRITGHARWLRGVQRSSRLLPHGRHATFDIAVPFTPWPSLLACLFRSRLGVRRVFWNHRGGHDSGGFLYTPFLVHTILRCDPFFLANSTAGREFLTKTFSLPPSAVSVVPNAFISEFEGTDATHTTHGRCSINDGVLRLAHVANFFPEKDGETLLRGVAILKRRRIASHLHIAGSFPDPTYRFALQRLAADLDIADNVTFHGTLNRQELADLLCTSDVGILSSKTEGMPNSVMEYMYWSLPVVATDIPGVRELLGEENSKWLFPVGDAASLGDILSSLAGPQAPRRKIGGANRQRLVANFSPDRIMPQWSRLLGMAPLVEVVP